jgi:hypothetical protein
MTTAPIIPLAKTVHTINSPSVQNEFQFAGFRHVHLLWPSANNNVWRNVWRNVGNVAPEIVD